jgi:hypothetical protein
MRNGRDGKIVHQYLAGETAAAIASAHRLSRQRIYRILKAHDVERHVERHGPSGVKDRKMANQEMAMADVVRVRNAHFHWCALWTLGSEPRRVMFRPGPEIEDVPRDIYDALPKPLPEHLVVVG